MSRDTSPLPETQEKQTFVWETYERVKDMPIGTFPSRLLPDLLKLMRHRDEFVIGCAEKIAAFLDGTEESDT